MKLLIVAGVVWLLWVTGWLWPVVVLILVTAAIFTADLRRAHW